MGLCRDFGSHISQGCDHPMRADSDSCHCEQCGVVCRGKFEACPSVWAQGPQPVVFAPAQSAEAVVFAPAPSTDATWIPPATNGHARQEAAAPQPSANGTEAEAHTVTAAPLTSGGAGDVPPAPVSDTGTGTEVFRWFQNAFDALRQEVEGLRTALSQEQALAATLLESRLPDAERDEEALREMVTAAVRKAVRRETAELTTAVAATVAELRGDLAAVREAQESTIAGLEASIAAIAADSAALPAELNRRDAASRKAFRVTLNQELEPLVEVVADSVAQSDYELKGLGRKLDLLHESGAALSAALIEVSASLGGTDARSGSPLLDGWADDLDGSADDLGGPEVRTATTRPGKGASRRSTAERPRAAAGEPRAAGLRVSLPKRP